jgi:cytochrome c-type biogenesis protein CcmH/NrfF
VGDLIAMRAPGLRSTAAWIWIALVLVLAVPATAEEATWGYELSHELMSPFCPGRTLASCPSSKADELRVWILMQEAAGATREEVEAELVARYGQAILPAPAPEDATGIVGYAVPILAIVAGAPLVFWLLRRLTTAPQAPPTRGPAAGRPTPATGPADDEYAARVDRELRELDA